MMSTYSPDAWVMLKITTKETTVYKILGTWYGGWAGADRWKLSSGTVTLTKKEYPTGIVVYSMAQHSGSVYEGTEMNYKMSAYGYQIYAGFLKDVKSMPGVFITPIMSFKDIPEIYDES